MENLSGTDIIPVLRKSWQRGHDLETEWPGSCGWEGGGSVQGVSELRSWRFAVQQMRSSWRFPSRGVTCQVWTPSGSRRQVMGIWLRKAAVGGRGEQAWRLILFRHRSITSHQGWPEWPPSGAIQDNPSGKSPGCCCSWILPLGEILLPFDSGYYWVWLVVHFLGYPELISMCDKFNCSWPQQISSHFPQSHSSDFGAYDFPRLGPSSLVSAANSAPFLQYVPPSATASHSV